MQKMRLLLVCAVLLAGVGLFNGPRRAAASLFCSTTCPGGSVLTCCTNGTCTTSGGGSVTCDGVTMNCSDADAYKACKATCDSQYSSCLNGCTDLPAFCSRMCRTDHNDCLADCGPKPTTSIGC